MNPTIEAFLAKYKSFPFLNTQSMIAHRMVGRFEQQLDQDEKKALKALKNKKLHDLQGAEDHFVKVAPALIHDLVLLCAYCAVESQKFIEVLRRIKGDNYLAEKNNAPKQIIQKYMGQEKQEIEELRQFLAVISEVFKGETEELSAIESRAA